MKSGNAGYGGPIGGGGAGPVGGGGAGPVGGGGAGPVGGGGASQKIFKHVAHKLEELSELFEDLAGTPLGGVGGGLAGSGAVDFNPQILFIEERQQGCELCWIAVAVSVKHQL
jgi:hypothetical protein